METVRSLVWQSDTGQAFPLCAGEFRITLADEVPQGPPERTINYFKDQDNVEILRGAKLQSLKQ